MKRSTDKQLSTIGCNHPASRLTACALLCILGVAQSASAFDEDLKSNVSKAYQEASDNYRAGRYCEAAQGFQRALDAIPLPVSALWAARAQVKCGDLIAAAKIYETATHLAPNELWIDLKQQRAQVSSADELENVRRRIPHLVVNVSTALEPDSQVTIDGVPLPHEAYGTKSVVNPGPHVIVLHRGDYTIERHITVAEQQSLVVQLQVEPEPELRATQPVTPTRQAESATASPSAGGTNGTSPSPFMPTPRPERNYTAATVIAVGIGAAGVTAGVITRLLAFGQKSTIGAHCDQTKACDATGMDAVNRANSLQVQSTVYFLVGLAGIGTGIGLGIAGAEKPKTQARLTTIAVPAGAGLGLEQSF